MSTARDISRQSSIQTASLTDGQTAVTVTGGFSGSSLDVYLNGARIVQGQDYSLNGTSGITLTQSASADDIIEFSIRNTSNSGFSAADTGQIVDSAVTYNKLSNSLTEEENVKKRVAAAWVNFNGRFSYGSTTAVNISAGIRDSYNIDSVTDLGSTGYYRINFTRPFANNDWVMAGTGRWNQYANNTAVDIGPHRNRTLDSAMNTHYVIITTTYSSGSLHDAEYVGLVFFGQLT